jgi:hypothetical protein
MSQPNDSHYAFTSARFWCPNCSRSFSSLNIGNEIHCPRCDTISHIQETRTNLSVESRLPSDVTITSEPLDYTITSEPLNPVQESTNSLPIQSEQPTGASSQSSNHQFFIIQQTYLIAPNGSFIVLQNLVPVSPNAAQPQAQPSQAQNVPQPNQEAQHNDQSNEAGSNSDQGQNSSQNPFLDILAGMMQMSNPMMMMNLRMFQDLLRNNQGSEGVAPASKETIERLGEFEYKPEMGTKTCSVCLADAQGGDKFVTLDCKHEYHKGCVTQWLNMHNSCPLCRKPLQEVSHVAGQC